MLERLRPSLASAVRASAPKMSGSNGQLPAAQAQKVKLHGRAFYESIGSPKLVLAPMVNQSEFAWRMLSRSFMTPEASKGLLAYSPMLHAKLFSEQSRYRETNFQPIRSAAVAKHSDAKEAAKEEELFLDGNPKFDRPLFVQFCANSPDALLGAAKHVQEHCDAVDLNLGCPQGIARKGHYGAFLQEDWELIRNLINKLHVNLSVPITAKMRVLETKEKTLDYAKMILNAGASIITVHGRQREQKGHNTGLADWSVIRYLREQLPSETVIFANGNILQHDDIAKCLEETGADGVMSAEGNLYDPTIFAEPPPIGEEGREYWRGRDGKGGFRVDAVLRRYADILYKYVLEVEPPEREPLFILSDPVKEKSPEASAEEDSEQPPRKKQKMESSKKQQSKATNVNLSAAQPHLFHLLRPLVSTHHDVRDALARFKGGDMGQLEDVIKLVERVVQQGLLEYEDLPETKDVSSNSPATATDPTLSSQSAIERCRRPFFICQPHIRPLPAEAFEKGSMQLSKKEREKQAKEQDTSIQPTSHALPDEKRPEPAMNGGATVEAAAVYG